jgi:hypothetical protein
MPPLSTSVGSCDLLILPSPCHFLLIIARFQRYNGVQRASLDIDGIADHRRKAFLGAWIDVEHS